eukprot:gene19716-20182_t
MGRKVSTAAVTDSYTLLCDLSLRPVAQVLMLRANRSSDARDLLRSEPLAAHGVFEDDWQLLRAEVRDDEDESLSADLRSDPFLFVGLYGNQKKKEQQRGQQFDSSLEYHIAQNTLSEEDPDKIQRVSLLAKLTAIDEEEEEREIQAANADKSDEGQEDDRDSDSASSATSGRNLAGLLVLFSATSVKDAQRYIEADAALSSYSSTLLSPVNLQDVSGMHHMMARNFGEKSELDKIHFMDPEDLLLLAEGVPSILNPNPGKNLFGSGNPTFLTHLREEQESGALQLLQPLVSIPSLPNHYQDNQAALLQLQRDGVSYRYNRLDIEERLGEGMAEKAAQWNKAMNKFQKALIKAGGADS